MITESIESFSIVAECLKRSDYKNIQYFPKHRIRHHPGREFLLIRSFLLKDRITLFRGSALHSVYEQLMRSIYPKLFNLYRLFFRCEELSMTVLTNFFNQHDLDILIRDNIISCADGQCISNYRFIPLDDLLIISSPDCEYDTANYVYIGEDTIILCDFLRKEFNEHVKDALEIGCGTGFLSLWMSRIAQNVTATDISERALEFTGLNSNINGINNVVTKISDVYSDVHGKFGLIISNPPFVFLPKECVGRTFAFGAHLGMGILEKILLGLNDHLTDNGISFIIAVSYIKEDGTNTLFDLIKNIFQGKPYSITLKQIDYHPLQNHYSFYRQHGISYSIRYLIKIQKAPAYQLKHFPIRGAYRGIETLKIKLLDRPK